jgi:membrane protein implicated in regulation of membrane protease activity
MHRNILLISLLLIYPNISVAYIGPGLGAGVIATAIGFVGAILIGFFAVLYYPIKRIIKKRKSRTSEEKKEEENYEEKDSTDT